MPDSDHVRALDGIQARLRPILKERGYRVRGRTFNCVTEDGLTQVVNLQMGNFDPPGTTYVPGLRENLYGAFTVNLGIYIPEVAALAISGPAKSWVQAGYCSIHHRLGFLSDGKDIWWNARSDLDVFGEVCPRLLEFGLPFLARFSTRNQILRELDGKKENIAYCSVPRIVSAKILAARNRMDEARALLTAQAVESANVHHSRYVRELAARMGLGTL